MRTWTVSLAESVAEGHRDEEIKKCYVASEMCLISDYGSL